MNVNEELYPISQVQGYVVQANGLIRAKQELSKNEAKLIRMVITEHFRSDTEFKPCSIPIKTFCDSLNLDLDQYCGKNAQKICSGIAAKPVKIQDGRDWKVIPWVTICEYKGKKNSDRPEGTIIIKLNEELKPYILNLKEYYTQYDVDNILLMQSTYSIRIFEMLFSGVYNSVLPREGAVVDLSVEELRICCNCENKYSTIGMLKKRVIDKAVKEICALTVYAVDYVVQKSGRKTIGFRFHIQAKFHQLKERENQKALTGSSVEWVQQSLFDS